MGVCIWVRLVAGVASLSVSLAACAVIATSEIELRGPDWRKLNGEQIERALNSRTLGYGSSIQDFFESGRTLYDADSPSWGNWRVQANQYCSQWPPLQNWTCYDLYVHSRGLQLRFEGPAGGISVGRYIDLG